MLNKEVKVKHGGYVADFGDGSRLKSDLALSTNIPAPTINEIVDKVRNNLSKHKQPVSPHDIATTTHFVMVEMGLKNEGKEYMQFIVDRQENRRLPKEKITYVKCDHCGATNETKHNFCIVCGSTLDKGKMERKII